MKTVFSLLLSTLLFLSPLAVPAADQHAVPAIQDTETKAERDLRMEWWREARFGMFIHWGLYSVAAGIWHGKQVPGYGEWIMHDGKIPVLDYKAQVSKFDPEKFNADAWVKLAKDAGMKYIVITSKHHEGFAMYHSAANKFNIYDATPFKRDPLQELAAACRKYGIKLGFYYSQNQDWTAPGGAAYNPGHWDPAQDGDFKHYYESKALPQLKELLTNYGEFPAVIWYDTPAGGMTPELAAETVALTNQHKSLIWNNRLGGGYLGDTETPEQRIPPQGYPGKDWETCMTINNTWGYKSQDKDFKSAETLLHNLIDIASKGGNYLLNVGPDATGTIPAEEVSRLREIGKWLDVNGEAIYGTSGTPFGDEAGSYSATEKDKHGDPAWIEKWEWRATQKPGKIYLHLFVWPQKEFKVDKVTESVTNAYLLADPNRKPLRFEQKNGRLSVKLPRKALDPAATVIVLETR